MKKYLSKDQDGFILVWALLLLIVVTLLGAAGISTSIFEERMAANEALHKQAFYQADGGTENALALIVENINCITGFAGPLPYTLDGGITIDDSLNFWQANYGKTAVLPTTTERDFHYPGAGTDVPYTHGVITSDTELMVGSNLPMLAGYEGKGKAMGQDGAFLEYDIISEHRGVRNSRVAINTKFRLDNQFSSYPSNPCIY